VRFDLRFFVLVLVLVAAQMTNDSSLLHYKYRAMLTHYMQSTHKCSESIVTSTSMSSMLVASHEY